MQIRKSVVITSVETWTVHVDSDELVVESGKRLPYPTCIGTFNARGTINVWSPAAHKPRGYVAAARAALKSARDATIPERAYKLVWSPEGKTIATVRARTESLARRKAPKPYRRFLGEIAVEIV